MDSTKNRLRLKLIKRAAEAEQNKDAKTSPLETAKAVEPTAIASSDEVSTTVPGTRLVVAHPDDPVSLKIQRRPSKELAAKKLHTNIQPVAETSAATPATASISSFSIKLQQELQEMDNDFTVETVGNPICTHDGVTTIASSKQRPKEIIQKQVDVETVRSPVKSRRKESTGSYLCSICARMFQHNFDLRRHVRTRHVEIDVETFCPRKTKKIQLCACSCCSKTFTDSNRLRIHVRQKHRDVDVNNVCPYKRRRTEHSSDPTEVHTCNECSKAFLQVKSLRQHVRAKHPSMVPCLQSKAYGSTLKCPVCAIVIDGVPHNKRMPALIKHLNEEHEQHLSYEHLTFETDQLFKEWLCKIENEVPCSFNRLRTFRKNRPEIYICNKSRVSQPSKAKFIPRNRKLKVQGRSYVGFTCPAHIKRKKNESGVYVVQYLACK